MEELTPKQGKVLTFIKEYIGRRSYPPTVREIGRHFKFRSLNSAAKYLKILEKKGYVRRRASGSRALELMGLPRLATSLVPVVGQITAGRPALAEENIEGHIALDASLAGRDDSFFLKVAGDSMEGAHIQDGDYALIQQQRSARNGQIVAVMVNEEATLKYFYRSGDYIELRAANPAYPPIVLTNRDQLFIIGRLVSIVRRYGK